jgi:hypothetical protein
MENHALNLGTLLEFMRIKAPELNIRQNQLARIIFIFFILNIFLFLVITDGIGSVSLRLKNPVNITELIYISEPRVFVVLGTTLVVFFYFVRFGYLYLQSVKEVASAHNVIDAILPYGKYPTSDIRESLMQTCRSNYIVQTIVVFLYTPKMSNNKYMFTEGPLGGSTSRRGMFIKTIMILTTIAVEWIIAVSQFLMIVVFLAFAKWVFAALLFVAFSLYYGFYFEYVIRNAIRLKEGWIWAITVVAIALIGISSSANLYVLLVNYDRSPNVFACRMTFEKISEISPPAATFVSFLFKERTEEQKVTTEDSKSADVLPCKLGKN